MTQKWFSSSFVSGFFLSGQPSGSEKAPSLRPQQRVCTEPETVIAWLTTKTFDYAEYLIEVTDQNEEYYYGLQSHQLMLCYIFGDAMGAAKFCNSIMEILVVQSKLFYGLQQDISQDRGR
jgi:hypothetical protein